MLPLGVMSSELGNAMGCREWFSLETERIENPPWCQQQGWNLQQYLQASCWDRPVEPSFWLAASQGASAHPIAVKPASWAVVSPSTSSVGLQQWESGMGLGWRAAASEAASSAGRQLPGLHELWPPGLPRRSPWETWAFSLKLPHGSWGGRPRGSDAKRPRAALAGSEDCWSSGAWRSVAGSTAMGTVPWSWPLVSSESHCSLPPLLGALLGPSLSSPLGEEGMGLASQPWPAALGWIQEKICPLEEGCWWFSCPNAMEWLTESTGFFGGSLQVTKGRTWLSGKNATYLLDVKARRWRHTILVGEPVTRTKTAVAWSRPGGQLPRLGIISVDGANHWVPALRQGTAVRWDTELTDGPSRARCEPDTWE